MLPTDSSFCFGQFIFKVIFSRIVSVSVTYFHSSASLRTTKRFPAVDLFIGRVSSRFKTILTGGSSMGKKGLGTLVCIVIVLTSRFSFPMSLIYLS